ncbi:MAG: DNA repair protein RecO [Cycloclasticus sp.]|nr:DNA repair protein RecO [Cycloclasticus sp.]
MNRVDQQPSFILKSQAFKETSVIHQVFTRDYGVLSIISKGSRAKKSKHGSLLQPFKRLLLSWVGKGELKTLTSVEQSGHDEQLKGTSLYCGFYVNELVLSLLHKHDAHCELFNALEKVILQLSENLDIEPKLRQFEKTLFEEIGYGLLLDVDIDTQEPIKNNSLYNYQLGYGAKIENNAQNPQAISGGTLINLRENKLKDKVELSQAKRLMRRLIDAQLDGKTLKSRELFI